LKRTAVKGSPIVPNSIKKIVEEGDLIMYSMTILRGHYEAGYFLDDAFTPGNFKYHLSTFVILEKENLLITWSL
jgi:hypothetical protein